MEEEEYGTGSRTERPLKEKGSGDAKVDGGSR